MPNVLWSSTKSSTNLEALECPEAGKQTYSDAIDFLRMKSRSNLLQLPISSILFKKYPWSSITKGLNEVKVSERSDNGEIERGRTVSLMVYMHSTCRIYLKVHALIIGLYNMDKLQRYEKFSSGIRMFCIMGKHVEPYTYRLFVQLGRNHDDT